MFYPHPGKNVSFVFAAVSIVLLLAVTIVILRFATKRRYLVMGWFWYLGTLIPVIGLVQVGVQAFSDRYSYITLTGLFIIIAWGISELLEKWRHRKVVLWASSLIILSALAICAHLQQRYWKNSITLCQHALAVTEDNYKAHFCMAPMLIEQGRVDEAIRHNAEAIRIQPDCIEALNGLGTALYTAGRIDEAISYYKKALEVSPQLPHAHANLGIALADKGKFAEAVEHYRIAIETIDTPQIHGDFGYALLNLGRYQESIIEYRKVLLSRTDIPDVFNDIGVALYHLKKLDEAIAHFNQALKIDPNHAAAKKNLAVVLAERQKSQNTGNTLP
jgi:tetratricopeptide (TPR) repeat protein